MNPQDNNQTDPQTQVIERLRTAVNVLVTVSNNPSVDQLSAAIGFTLALNKMGKHATAVFSGDVPSTIEFLKPNDTIEKTTDSLRDFIVSLDKSKADKLRYKVEENVVKIFITPYRTSLSEKDLNFSQGDFNVDAVVALGVSEREQLDQAIISHGRILHDATVITVSAGKQDSTLGTINWQDTTASSLCEMLVTIGDSLESGLLDNQIATAYLTGIVAQTERFRNDKTTPKLMSLSAQLMAAGANQQLIASSLEKKTESVIPAAITTIEKKSEPESVVGKDGSLTIEHDPNEPKTNEPEEHPKEKEHEIDDYKKTDVVEDFKSEETSEINIDEHGNLVSAGTKAEEPVVSEPKVDQKHKVIEPLTNAEKDGSLFNSNMSFSANMAEENEMESSVDPLSETTTLNHAVLDHDPIVKNDLKQENRLESDRTSDDMMLPPVAQSAPALDVATLPPALDDSTLHELEKSVDSPHVANDPTSTLNEIEEAVKSPHVTEAPLVAGVDSARDAVSSAINSAPYDTNRPEPVKALNAEALDLDTVTPNVVEKPQDFSQSTLPPAPVEQSFPSYIQSTEPVVPPSEPEPTPQPITEPANSMSPPPVPPPMMPLK